MVCADAAHPHAPEGKLRIGQVYDGVIYAPAAVGKMLYNGTFCFSASGKKVQRQGLVPVPDKEYCLIQLIIYQDGKDRAEDFLLHHRVFRGNVPEDCGGNIALRRIGDASCDRCPLPEEPREPPEMIVVNDAAVVGTQGGIITVEIVHFGLHVRKERILHVLLHQKVIGGDTGLAAVEKFSPYDAPRRRRNISVAVDNAGALAPKFQGNRGQVTGRLFCDDLSHHGAPCEKYIVVGFIEELFADIDTPPECCPVGPAEHGADNLLYYR